MRTQQDPAQAEKGARAQAGVQLAQLGPCYYLLLNKNMREGELGAGLATVCEAWRQLLREGGTAWRMLLRAGWCQGSSGRSSQCCWAGLENGLTGGAHQHSQHLGHNRGFLAPFQPLGL